jgi:hypothetical protein
MLHGKKHLFFSWYMYIISSLIYTPAHWMAYKNTNEHTFGISSKSKACHFIKTE